MIPQTTTIKPSLVNLDLESLFKYIDDNIIDDLITLNNIKEHKNESLTNCTVPQALSVFSFADLMGFLLRAKLYSDSKNTQENIQYFFIKTKLFSSEYEKYFPILLKIYRNALTHQFFPKSNLFGITKYSSELESLLIEESLNVKKLTIDVIHAFTTIKQQCFHDTILADRLLANWRMLDLGGKEDVILSFLSLYPKPVCEQLIDIYHFRFRIIIQLAVDKSMDIYLQGKLKKYSNKPYRTTDKVGNRGHGGYATYHQILAKEPYRTTDKVESYLGDNYIHLNVATVDLEYAYNFITDLIPNDNQHIKNKIFWVCRRINNEKMVQLELDSLSTKRKKPLLQDSIRRGYKKLRIIKRINKFYYETKKEEAFEYLLEEDSLYTKAFETLINSEQTKLNESRLLRLIYDEYLSANLISKYIQFLADQNRLVSSSNVWTLLSKNTQIEWNNELFLKYQEKLSLDTTHYYCYKHIAPIYEYHKFKNLTELVARFKKNNYEDIECLISDLPFLDCGEITSKEVIDNETFLNSIFYYKTTAEGTHGREGYMYDHYESLWVGLKNSSLLIDDELFNYLLNKSLVISYTEYTLHYRYDYREPITTKRVKKLSRMAFVFDKMEDVIEYSGGIRYKSDGDTKNINFIRSEIYKKHNPKYKILLEESPIISNLGENLCLSEDFLLKNTKNLIDLGIYSDNYIPDSIVCSFMPYILNEDFIIRYLDILKKSGYEKEEWYIKLKNEVN